MIANPLGADTVSVEFRKGWHQIVVTNRRTVSKPETWSDLFGAEGVFLEPTRLVLDRGAQAEIAVLPGTVPHAWARSDDVVVTATGPVPEAVFQSMLSSLRR